MFVRAVFASTLGLILGLPTIARALDLEDCAFREILDRPITICIGMERIFVPTLRTAHGPPTLGKMAGGRTTRSRRYSPRSPGFCAKRWFSGLSIENKVPDLNPRARSSIDKSRH
jgi:hypothetical protein